MHSEKGLVKSTTDIQLRIISAHHTIFSSIKYGVVHFTKVPLLIQLNDTVKVECI